MKIVKSCALLAVATALFSTPKHEESLTEKAAHLLTHPSDILARGDTPQDPKVMKDVCPECNKNQPQPALGHVQQIIEEAAKTGQATWEAAKDKVTGVAGDAAKQAASRRAEEHTGGAWESIKESVGNVKDKILGGADVVPEPAKHSHYPSSTEEHAGGAWDTLKEGVESVKEKLVGGAKPVDTTQYDLDEIRRQAADMMAHPELYLQGVRDSMSNLASKAADTVHPYSSRVSDAIRPASDKASDTPDQTKKHGAWNSIKESVETVKDKLVGGAKPVDTTQQSLDEIKRRAADMLANPQHYLHRAEESMSDMANRAADSVHPYSTRVSDAIRPSSDKVTETPDQMKDVCPECHKHDSDTKPLQDLKHRAEAVRDDVTSGVSDAVKDLRYGAEHMATRAADAATRPLRDLKNGVEHTAAQVTDTIKTGAGDIQHKVADSIPDVSVHGIKDRMGDMTHKVADTVTKPFHYIKEGVDEAGHRVAETASSIKEGAESAKDRVSDAASRLLHGESVHQVGTRAPGMPSDWYAQMIEVKESLDKQMQELSSGSVERLSFVQQNVQKVNGSWISYLNDNGKEYLDVQLGDGVDASAVDPLVAINSARRSHGMPTRHDLADVKVQIHQREKPHFFVRTTRILPNGVWTRYENDNGVELITEGHVSKKDVSESSLEKMRPDNHPLLNMFRRTFGLPELVEKKS